MFKDFVSLYKPYKKLFFLDIFSALMMTGIDMLFPLSVSYLVDNVIPARNMRILCILCIAVLLGYIVKYFFEKVVIYYGHVLGVSLENSLRKRVFEQYEKFSFFFLLLLAVAGVYLQKSKIEIMTFPTVQARRQNEQESMYLHFSGL